MINSVPNAEMMTANDTQVLDKKLRDYGNHDDFVAPRELTVTITLNEYRSLVMAKGAYDKTIDDLRNKNYKLEQQVQTLTNKLTITPTDEARRCDEA